jgi:2-oxoglutarate dehydrogenase E1 component
MSSWGDIKGLNQAYVVELYDRFQQNPESVDPTTRAAFERWAPPADAGAPERPGPSPADVRAIVGAVNLADSIRRYGHLAAQIDPLGSRPVGDPALMPETHGVSEDDLRRVPAALLNPPAGVEAGSASDVIQALRRIYQSTIGYDYAHIFVPEEREWLREAAEAGRFRAPSDPIDPVALLGRLTQVEVFERFLHRTFPGKTRFSIEGLDMLVPVLDELVGEAAEADIRHILIGMAHRGRLNVLAHVLQKPYAQILAEFKDPLRGRNFREDMAWTGDVKYHSGALRALQDGREVDLLVEMPPNPSHLEAVDPVVAGMARAAGTRVDAAGAPAFNPALTLPILIHGDAAFPGQGIVAETLNLARLPGYTTGGTVHLIANNQVGFTTLSGDAYSTLYSSGLARGFKVPIVHVNADDPEACIEAARLAFAYRARFHKDFLIDLVGYRRHGHNEGDEPAFTQPRMYQAIAGHPTVRERWARVLVERGGVDAGTPDALVRADMEKLQRELDGLQPERDLVEPFPDAPPPGAARDTRTSVPLARLRALNDSLLRPPEGFTSHRKLEKARERRRHALDQPDERTIDWATAEELAFASILADGIAIRLTGQDVERGTFSQRHAVFHDVATGTTFTPLQSLPQARAAFEVHNSPLSENAAVGFEYGYNVQAPGRLTVWEAQYGDFINGAQVILDEFVLSARAKWGQTPSLVLLLPHGQEGQGPDHASARPERFLQLAADINLRLANCTTAAQYFHLLRRQAALLTTDPLPLIVLTPKGLLRHPLVASTPRELAEGSFQQVLDDGEARSRAGEVRRLVLCSGKIFVDLATSDARKDAPHVAICRLEQLYPFPFRELQAVLRGYPGLEEIVWVQEEPENMGAWLYGRPHLEELVGGRWPIKYLGRSRNSSPADGSAARHAHQQARIVASALEPVVVRI